MNTSEARAFHDETPVVDLHADTLKLADYFNYDIAGAHDTGLPAMLNYAGHVDIPRMSAAGLSGQFFGMWTFPYPQRGCAASVHRQLDALGSLAARCPDMIGLANTVADLQSLRLAGKIACLTGIEGGHALEGDLDNIARFAKRGVRYIGLVHFTPNQIGSPGWGTGLTYSGGLSAFGREAIAEMNRLGVIVDLAHINRRGFYDALETTSAPVMVTHTGVAGVHHHQRNIDDDQVRAIANNGGCVGIIFAKRFLGANTIDSVCDHILHLIDVAGEETPALGSDFDGFVVPPTGLDDVASLPKLTAALARHGVNPKVLTKILGGNALRVLGDVAGG